MCIHVRSPYRVASLGQADAGRTLAILAEWCAPPPLSHLLCLGACCAGVAPLSPPRPVRASLSRGFAPVPRPNFLARPVFEHPELVKTDNGRFEPVSSIAGETLIQRQTRRAASCCPRDGRAAGSDPSVVYKLRNLYSV